MPSFEDEVVYGVERRQVEFLAEATMVASEEMGMVSERKLVRYVVMGQQRVRTWVRAWVRARQLERLTPPLGPSVELVSLAHDGQFNEAEDAGTVMPESITASRVTRRSRYGNRAQKSQVTDPSR